MLLDMKLKLPLLLIFGLLATSLFGQQTPDGIEIVKTIAHTPVISQGNTGTCWSFATTSFLESEILRKGFPETDLSEMYFVNFAYLNKARKYLLYHGDNSFSQGGQAHDVFDVVRQQGVSTFDGFPGILVDGRYRHHDLVKDLDKEISGLNRKGKKFDAGDLETLFPILEIHMGAVPDEIALAGAKLTPVELAEKYEINPDDYVELTSYSHHPFYQPFVLEVPDNWSHGLYYNLPINELMEVIYNSLNNGYTVCWDGDTSEKYFNHRKGIADLPNKQQGKVDEDLRQQTFYERETTDDHLMHIVGLSKDNDGRNYFYTKNSWGGNSNKFGGYLHLSDDYVRLKTVAVLVHKNAIPDNIKSKLKL